MSGAIAALQSLSSINSASFADDEPGRRHALREARDLVSRLENSWEKLTELIWVHADRLAVLLIGIDINLFETLEKSPSGMTLEELSGSLPVKIDTALLKRILRMLVATGDVSNTKDDKFAPTPFSSAIATTTGIRSALLRAADMSSTALHLPIYLKKIEYRNPADANHGNHFDATGMDFFYKAEGTS
jgi:hypothetical protein